MIRVAALLAALAAGAAAAQAPAPPSSGGVEVQKSRLLLLPASMVERGAAQEYARMMQAAARKKALNRDAAQLERLRRIARDLVPHTARFSPEAPRWRWAVNLVRSDAVNAFCMPGGKIAFFSGILEKLSLDDDEIAAIMGHEMAHALLEHGRARLSEQILKQLGITVAAVVFNLSDLSATVLAQAAHLALSLPHSRAQERDADLAGMELAARAGYDPRAAAGVWRKMAALGQGSGAGAGRGQPPQFLSTHPSHANRIREIEAALPRVLPLYDPERRGRW